MAISFSHSHTYVINDDDISEIAALLCVDYKLLYKAINYCTNGVMPAEIIKIGEKYCNQKQIKNADLFSAIFFMLPLNSREKRNATKYIINVFCKVPKYK